ncbi:cyclic nucleotide-binding domain-containing protein [Pseudomonas sp.]|uniref:cyclic nucleotide-binding domain-containing protein n=1 Tax=Pseudomonas sp. TaxID=306 RepID=UPI003568F564
MLELTEGEQLYHQGDHADCFYVVLKGHLEIYQDSETGREVIHTACEGESVGFAAILAMRPPTVQQRCEQRMHSIENSLPRPAQAAGTGWQSVRDLFHQSVPGHESLYG